MNQVATRDMCYPSWNSKPTKFQVNKPQKPAREDKDFWMYESDDPILRTHAERWKKIYRGLLSKPAGRFTVIDSEGQRLGYRTLYTKPHFVCNFKT